MFQRQQLNLSQISLRQLITLELHSISTINLNDAMIYYERALACNPDFADAHNNIGIVHLDLGQLENAAKSYKAAIKIKPDFAEAHYNLGVVLQDLNQTGRCH